MTGDCVDLVTLGLEGRGWEQQEVRWVEKGGGVCRVCTRCLVGTGRKEVLRVERI